MEAMKILALIREWGDARVKLHSMYLSDASNEAYKDAVDRERDLYTEVTAVVTGLADSERVLKEIKSILF